MSKPKPNPNRLPVSKDEAAGQDNGPCRSFKAEEPPWEHTCANCGYKRGSHR